MMLAGRFVMAAFLSLTGGLSAAESETATTRSPRHWTAALLLEEVDAWQRTSRVSIAQGIAKDMAKFIALAPRLRASEVEWLAKERAAMAQLDGAALGDKMRSFAKSPEFQTERLSQTLQQVASGAQCVVEAVDPVAEARCWLQVSYYLTSPFIDVDLVSLGREGRLQLSAETKQELRLVDDDEPWFLYRRVGREIAWQLVMPVLHPDQPKRFPK
jgi:hypothetical protein